MKPGILLVDKPQGFTSFDVIAVLKRVLSEPKLGHAGTLDPMATGVLPVLVGKAAKALDLLPDSSKTYEADFLFGIATDTQDITGKTVKTSEKAANADEINAVLEGFKGRIMQTPPMYSAVSVNGKRLYELARQGIEIERIGREIEIFDIRLDSYDEATKKGRLFISCSKGAYVRTIINDMGERLGCFGCMTALRRTSSHGFSISECLKLDDIKNHCNIEKEIIPIDRVFLNYGRIDISEVQSKMYKNGVKLDAERVGLNCPDGIYRIYCGEFLGLCSKKDGEIRVFKNFWS